MENSAQAVRPSQVLIFGDSWAAYPLVPKTWPMQFADMYQARAFNFAVPGSRTDQLMEQFEAMITNPNPLRTSTGDLDPHTVAVIHTAGNDFMQRLGADLVQQLPGQAEASTIRSLMESLYSAGVRHFMVADVPFSPCVPGVRLAAPVIERLVKSGQMEHLGLEPEDPAELAVMLQSTALHDQWAEMIDGFQKKQQEAIVIHFDEAFALSRLCDSIGATQFDSRFFDMTLIHPSAYGHTLLAQEAQKCTQYVLCS